MKPRGKRISGHTQGRLIWFRYRHQGCQMGSVTTSAIPGTQWSKKGRIWNLPWKHVCHKCPFIKSQITSLWHYLANLEVYLLCLDKVRCSPLYEELCPHRLAHQGAGMCKIPLCHRCGPRTSQTHWCRQWAHTIRPGTIAQLYPKQHKMETQYKADSLLITLAGWAATWQLCTIYWRGPFA